MAYIQDGREYITAYSKRIFQPSKLNDPNSSSFRAGAVGSHASSSPTLLTQSPAVPHGIGLPLPSLESLSCSTLPSCFQMDAFLSQPI